MHEARNANLYDSILAFRRLLVYNVTRGPTLRRPCVYVGFVVIYFPQLLYKHQWADFPAAALLRNHRTQSEVESESTAVSMHSQILHDRYIDDQKLHTLLTKAFGIDGYRVRVKQLLVLCYDFSLTKL